MKMRILFGSLLFAATAAIACTAGPGGGESGGDGDTGGDGDLNLGDGDGDGGGDGDLDIGDGDGVNTPGGEDNLLGITTNVILEPECASDCLGFSDNDAPLVVIEGTVDQGTLDAGGTPDGICVAEPANGTIFPAAWTRPRFHVPGASGPGKVTLSTPRMKHDFTMYVESMPAILPLEVWDALSRSVHNEDITYTVVTNGGQATGTFQIAPVAAGGSMVFWGSSEGVWPGGDTNALYGFGVGDEGVIRAVTPGEIEGTAVEQNAQLRTTSDVPPGGNPTPDGKSACVGCHASTPDGKAVASIDDWEWNARLYSIEPGTIGQPPDYLTPAGAAMLGMTWLGGTTFSLGDWADAPAGNGRRRMVTTWVTRDYEGPSNVYRIYDGNDVGHVPTELIWIDLAAQGAAPVDISRIEPAEYTVGGTQMAEAVAALVGTAWDVIPRTGDANSPILPDWSHDGDRIAYTSTDAPRDGRVGGASVCDIYTMPFNDGAGGEATPVAGASEAGFFEYYPDYAPDDSLLAFNRVAQFAAQVGKDDAHHVYYRPDSEIYVVPSAGGTATRLTSNDAVCEGTTGSLHNSWAKWAPSSATDGSRTYYFLIFSTSRNSPGLVANKTGGTKGPASQLYITTVIKEADGTITSSPGIYLWNQRNLVEGTGDAATIAPLGTNNVTPAWDEFKIPPVPPVVVR